MTEEQLRSYPKRVREMINAWVLYAVNGRMSAVLGVTQPKRGHYLIEFENRRTGVVFPGGRFYVDGTYRTFEDAYNAHWGL